MSSFGSSQTTQANTQEQSSGSQTGTNTPTEAANVTNFRNSLYPQISNLIAQAGRPVYGAAQQAQFQNALNKNTEQGLNGLASQLAARTGSLNSGAYATGIQNMLNQRIGQQANYNAMVPAANQQAQLQNLGSALGIGANFAGRAPVGSQTSGTTAGTRTSDSTQTVSQNPSIFSDIMGVASAGMGLATGLGGLGMFGGFSPFGAGSSAAVNAGLQGGMNAGGYFRPGSLMGNMGDLSSMGMQGFNVYPGGGEY